MLSYLSAPCLSGLLTWWYSLSLGVENVGAMGLILHSLCLHKRGQLLCRSFSHALYQCMYMYTQLRCQIHPSCYFHNVDTHTHTQGCFTAIPLAFILPTASYLKLSTTKWYSRGKLIALSVLILGVIVMFIGTGLAIKKVSYHKRLQLWMDIACVM